MLVSSLLLSNFARNVIALTLHSHCDRLAITILYGVNRLVIRKISPCCLANKYFQVRKRRPPPGNELFL